MSKLHASALTAIAFAAAMMPTQANAQLIFRGEVQGGYSEFNAAGDDDGSLGWGAAAGVDYDFGGFLLGVEGTFWWPGACFNASSDCPTEVETVDGPGYVEHKSFEEWGIALRAGMMLSPSTLVYVKGGAVRNEQRKRFTPINPLNGLLDSSLPGGYYDHYKRGGWTAGAGIEHQFSGPLYVKAEGRYSDYKKGQVSGGTHMITGLLGIGVKFGGPRVAEVVAPPPPVVAAPPPPPPPATQTCPDGSVILATDACPPPPPPPPPPPEPERG